VPGEWVERRRGPAGAACATSSTPDPRNREILTEAKQIEHWLCVLRGAERQLDAARLLSDVEYAARRLMNAKLELKRLGVDWRAHMLSPCGETPHRRPLRRV
jgi:hypothetical protein